LPLGKNGDWSLKTLKTIHSNILSNIYNGFEMPAGITDEILK
jgi:hypothetical protein